MDDPLYEAGLEGTPFGQRVYEARAFTPAVQIPGEIRPMPHWTQAYYLYRIEHARMEGEAIERLHHWKAVMQESEEDHS